MPYKRKYRSRSRSRKKSFRKRARGKYTLKRRVNRILNQKTETKFFDIADENEQLYHNIGYSPVVPATNFEGSLINLFNPWADIPAGTGRANRIGEKISPIGMSLKLWLSNKGDRMDVMYRVIVAVLPRANAAGALTTYSNLPLFNAAQLGNNGNKMTLPLDKDLGVKALYDRIYSIKGSEVNKEYHRFLKLWIKRKRSRPIVYNNAQQTIVNNPLAVYVIPYDAYGTLTTDNIASCAYYCRLYYKDI